MMLRRQFGTIHPTGTIVWVLKGNEVVIIDVFPEETRATEDSVQRYRSTLLVPVWEWWS
jgi:hypothetical protein